MSLQKLHIIMPVKDSIDTAEQAIRAIVRSGHHVTIYNDNSTPENTERLHTLAGELSIEVIDIARMTNHPSPNYRYVLIDAREKALEKEAALVIVESDVIVENDTLTRLAKEAKAQESVGMIASVTHDREGKINFPYEYLGGKQTHGDMVIETRKRLSFCCTLLSQTLLRNLDFEQELDESKNWYDVTISHRSVELGMRNLVMLNNPVLHMPHSSRPWKKLKYTNPLLYYWRKFTQHLDKI